MISSSLIYYQNYIIHYNLILKLNITNIHQLPKIEKIEINLTFSDFNKKLQIRESISLFKILTNQLCFLVKSKQNEITGAKITLQKNNIFVFLEKLIFLNFLNEKNLINIINQKIVNIKIDDIFNFFELENEFLYFKNFPKLNIYLFHRNIKTKNQLKLFLSYYNFLDYS